MKQEKSSDAVTIADGLHSAAIHILRRLRTHDERSGIGPAQLSALSVLVFGGEKTLSELAQAEQVKAPTMTRIVAALEKAGLVARESDAQDARVSRVRATASGRSVMLKARERRVRALAELVAARPVHERRKLEEAVAVIRELMR